LTYRGAILSGKENFKRAGGGNEWDPWRALALEEKMRVGGESFMKAISPKKGEGAAGGGEFIGSFQEIPGGRRQQGNKTG